MPHGDFDTVTNVETLSFDDGDIAVSHDGTGLVLTKTATDNIEIVGPVGVTVLGEAGDDTLTGGAGNVDARVVLVTTPQMAVLIPTH